MPFAPWRKNLLDNVRGRRKTVNAFDRTSTRPDWRAGGGRWTAPRCWRLFVLICIGAVLVTASSPAVAVRIGASPFHFIHRQQFFLVLSLFVLFAVSMQSPQNVRRLAVIGFLVSLALMMFLPFMGMETKGAKRWLTLLGMSVQPSEFLKPCMAVVMAWIFHLRNQYVGFPGWRIAIGLYVIVVGLLLIQPDLGMVVTVSIMWALQFFLAGLPFIWVVMLPLLRRGRAVWRISSFCACEKAYRQLSRPDVRR